MHNIIQLQGIIKKKKRKKERIDYGYGYEIVWPFT